MASFGDEGLSPQNSDEIYKSEYKNSTDNLKKYIEIIFEANLNLIRMLETKYRSEFASEAFMHKFNKYDPSLQSMVDEYSFSTNADFYGMSPEERVVDDLFGHTKNPSDKLFGIAREYHLLRRMADISGLDPGPTLLDSLGLQAMQREFEREDAKREEGRGGRG